MRITYISSLNAADVAYRHSLTLQRKRRAKSEHIAHEREWFSVFPIAPIPTRSFPRIIKLIPIHTANTREFHPHAHARRSLSTVGGTHVSPPTVERSTASRVANQPPTTVLLSFTFILPPPERCKVSQQVWNRIMN